MLAQVFALLAWGEEVVRLELEGATGRREEGKEVGGRGGWEGREGIGEGLGVFEGLEAAGEDEER